MFAAVSRGAQTYWGFTAGEQADEAGFSGMDSAASALAAAMSLTDRTQRTPLMRLKGRFPAVVAALSLVCCFKFGATDVVMTPWGLQLC